MLGVIGLSAVVLTGCLKEVKEKVADVVETGGSTYCIMSTSEGGTVETWTKGKKTKVYGTNMGGGVGMGYMITDGQWTYMWVEGQTKGSKYPVTDEETPRSEGEGFQGKMPDSDSRQELANYQVDDYKQDCSKKSIPDSTFVPPAGIEFVDMMEKLGGSLEDFR